MNSRIVWTRGEREILQYANYWYILSFRRYLILVLVKLKFSSQQAQRSILLKLSYLFSGSAVGCSEQCDLILRHRWPRPPAGRSSRLVQCWQLEHCPPSGPVDTPPKTCPPNSGSEQQMLVLRIEVGKLSPTCNISPTLTHSSPSLVVRKSCSKIELK